MTKIYPGTVREVVAWAAGRDAVRVSTTPPPGARVLIIEDETTLAGMIAAYVSRAGFDSSVVHTGPDGVQAARDLAPDVVILDLGLPGLDGIEVCRQLRTFTDCYVIVVTARRTRSTPSSGCPSARTTTSPNRSASANWSHESKRYCDDPAPDPPPPPGPPVVNRPGCSVHYVSTRTASVCTWATSRWPSPPPNGDLLMALARRPSMAFSRRQLIDDIWGPDWVGDEHLVDVHVAHLRRKLGDDPETGRYITTVRGVGYRMGQG